MNGKWKKGKNQKGKEMRRQERKGKSEWVVKKRNNEVLHSVWERDRPGSTTPGGESSTLNATGTGFE